MLDHLNRLIDGIVLGSDAQKEVSNDKLDITLRIGDFLLMFSYLADAQQVLVTTCIADLPEENREAIYLQLLKGQYFFKETRGATLSVDEESHFVTLQLVRHLTLLTPQNFPVLVENFLQTALVWRERLTEGVSVSGVPAADEAFDANAMFNMLRV